MSCFTFMDWGGLPVPYSLGRVSHLYGRSMWHLLYGHSGPVFFLYKTDMVFGEIWVRTASDFFWCGQSQEESFQHECNNWEMYGRYRRSETSPIISNYVRHILSKYSRKYTPKVSGCRGFLGFFNLSTSCPYQDWVVKQWYASHSLFSHCIWRFPPDQAGSPAWSEMVNVYFIEVVWGIGHVCAF